MPTSNPVGGLVLGLYELKLLRGSAGTSARRATRVDPIAALRAD